MMMMMIVVATHGHLAHAPRKLFPARRAVPPQAHGSILIGRHGQHHAVKGPVHVQTLDVKALRVVAHVALLRI
jgi:hypothetical protein